MFKGKPWRQALLAVVFVVLVFMTASALAGSGGTGVGISNSGTTSCPCGGNPMATENSGMAGVISGLLS